VTAVLADTSILGLSPHGHLVCERVDFPAFDAFAAGDASGLIALGGQPTPEIEDASVHYWKRIADSYYRLLCQQPEPEGQLPPIPIPESEQLSDWTLNAPPMRGAEYLSPEVLTHLWTRLDEAVREQVATHGSIAAFLETSAPAWSRVGRVTLRLAENPKDPEFPFAFIATYASDLLRSGRVKQLPLGKALEEYSGARNKAALLKLLTPLQKAAAQCSLIADLLESGDLYHPLVLDQRETYHFLRHIPVYEASGLLVQMPNWWKKRGKRPKVAAVIGQNQRSSVGFNAMLDFKLSVELDGRTLTESEVKQLLRGEEGLVLFRGEWIEVDHARLQEALDHWRTIEAAGDGVSMVEGMRLLAGAPADLQMSAELEEMREWAFVEPGEALREMLQRMAQPEPGKPPRGLKATLRPYQASGLEWLWFCVQAGFGACLADDMGLGKTIQLLALLQRKKERQRKSPPALLVVPASLVGNWQREASRFTPSLRWQIVHPSEGSEAMAELQPGIDCVITTYGMLTRVGWLAETEWGLVILDEAQAIKNHGSRQSRAVRKLQANGRIALTGTPIENHLGDLWALFDFLNPGLLGSSGQFKHFVKQLRDANAEQYAPLRRLVAPYILRRLKTDRSIITDLPDKTEMKVFCGLAPRQAKLYKDAALALQKELRETDGIERRGLVLAYLMRFKQLCNHPDHLTKTGSFDPKDSGKFQRLLAICEELAERGEKALVFTQFRELTEPLEHVLSGVFDRSGLILHGGTPVRKRQAMVEAFQRESGPPFFVLSLKAGGTGLNLTAASHVIHFDRWWNPAVENQATDRAFRIGQKRNVLVHQFVTSGTLEERIDAMLTEKRETADAVLSEGAEKALTEMADDELLDFIRLDLNHASASLA